MPPTHINRFLTTTKVMSIGAPPISVGLPDILTSSTAPLQIVQSALCLKAYPIIRTSEDFGESSRNIASISSTPPQLRCVL